MVTTYVPKKGKVYASALRTIAGARKVLRERRARLLRETGSDIVPAMPIVDGTRLASNALTDAAAQNVLDTKPDRRHKSKSRDPKVLAAVEELMKQNLTKREICARLNITPPTLRKILNPHMVGVEKAAETLDDKLVRLTELAIGGTLTKGDHRTAATLVTQCGVPDAVREMREGGQRQQGGRIVIEWNGPMPEWAAPAPPMKPAELKEAITVEANIVEQQDS